ncbi:hypothetical protein UU9_05669 [Rhodanobacter fulvus Jip2]|uniref:Uncharacterized protein n=1 Tax=Rhodanobacter fulvus Jip2 TaxID=1163408 RepID=I4VSS7_9GAMM|nr:hypothetical protein [Rhodanobacter fulvus]EIL90268.1 hypothetical protein UU9_05669 [Rhodanobacter fulvus Jip2]
MNASRPAVVETTTQQGRTLAPEGSLRRDCAVYFRDLAMASIVFLPFWTLPHALRLLIVPH